MQGDRTSAALPAAMSKRRNIIVVSAVSSLLFLAAGIYVNERFQEISRDDVLSLAAMITMCVSLFVGIPAVVVGTKDVGSIRKGILPVSLQRATQWGRYLGVVGTSGNVILFVLFFVQALSLAGVGAAKESIIADLDTLFRVAHQYRLRPDSTKGGDGSYIGFAIYPSFAENEDGFYVARVIHPDTIQFIAKWREDSSAVIAVKLGPDGKPVDPWKFYGNFQQ